MEITPDLPMVRLPLLGFTFLLFFSCCIFNVELEHVEGAARMGDCSGWISRLSNGYDMHLHPSFNIHNGHPSEALTLDTRAVRC